METNEPIILKKGNPDPYLDIDAFKNTIAEFDKAIEKFKISGSEEDREQANLIRRELVKYNEAFNKQWESFRKLMKKSLPTMNNSIKNLSLSLSSLTQNSLESISAMSEIFQNIASLSTTNMTYFLDHIKEIFDSLPADEREEAGEIIREAIENNTQLQPQEQKEILKSIIPENYYITNNKLSNEIVKDFLNGGEISLAVIKPNKKGEVCTYNSLTYEGDNIKITGRQQFTAYDRTIHNAVCTLFIAGNEVVTPQMVYRTLNGMTETEYISPQAVGAVTKSLDKSRFTRLKVDFTAEAKARNIIVDKAIIDSNLLHAEVVIMAAGGREVSAYKILKIPALYEYAQLTKQIISIPLALLDTREATRNTEEIIPIKEYLIRRIEVMKHSDTTSNRIVYDTIFSEAGITLTSQKQRDRMRSYITSILSLWEKKYKYIKKFSEYKEGRTYKGIEITY